MTLKLIPGLKGTSWRVRLFLLMRDTPEVEALNEVGVAFLAARGE